MLKDFESKQLKYLKNITNYQIGILSLLSVITFLFIIVLLLIGWRMVSSKDKY